MKMVNLSHLDISFSVSEWAGLFALGLFALSFVLVIRWEPLIRLTGGGLAKQQRIHHFLGAIVLFAVFIHVAAELWSVPPSSWKFVFEPRNLGIFTGFLSLIFFIGAFGSTFLTLPFTSWRVFHWIFTLSFFLAGYHGVVFATHSYAVWAISIIGSLAVLFVGLWHFIIFPKKILTVISVERIGTLTYSLTLSIPNERKNPFRAGMVVYLRFREQGFSRGWHPFSVASCASAPNLKLVIKSLGHDTSLLGNLKRGALVDLHGPYTEFHVPEGQDQVWIAGGVGIATFFGLSQCLEFKQTGKVQLIYFAHPEDQVQTIELDRVSHACAQFQWKRIEVPLGELPDIKGIQDVIVNVSNPYFILSGPPKFKKYIVGKLQALGISKSHII